MRVTSSFPSFRVNTLEPIFTTILLFTFLLFYLFTFLPFSVFLSDLYTADLAADGLRQFIDELDDTRIFIRCSHLLHMLLQFLDEVLTSLVLPYRE